MKLYYLERPGGFYYAASFAVLADSAEAAAEAVNEYSKAEIAKIDAGQGGDPSEFSTEWVASDMRSAEVGCVVAL
jgi:hypothetical protein